MNNQKQNNILNNARKKGKKVIIFLVSGNKLEGVVEGFDDFVVILMKNGKQNMIYKQAISTIIVK